MTIGGRSYRAHRLSWQLHFGPVPPDLIVMHVCDTPLCVHPGHLVVGSPMANTRDMITKGRNAFRKGMANGNAKLTVRDIKEIRSMAKKGAAQKEIAALFGVNPKTISKIVRRELWSHVQ
jgi:hypothetical protein